MSAYVGFFSMAVLAAMGMLMDWMFLQVAAVSQETRDTANTIMLVLFFVTIALLFAAMDEYRKARNAPRNDEPLKSRRQSRRPEKGMYYVDSSRNNHITYHDNRTTMLRVDPREIEWMVAARVEAMRTQLEAEQYHALQTARSYNVTVEAPAPVAQIAPSPVQYALPAVAGVPPHLKVTGNRYTIDVGTFVELTSGEWYHIETRNVFDAAGNFLYRELQG